MAAETLDRLQRRMWRLITAPTGVADALSALADDDADALPLCSWVRAGDEHGATARLDVYANMYFYRLLDALREVYPRLTSLLGDTTFHNLVTDYLLAHPSTHPSIDEVGRILPEYLQHHGLVDGRPFLPDLAALEWIRGQVFDLPASKPLGGEALGRLAPEEWASLRLRPVHALRVLQVHHPVDQLWNALRDGEVPQPEAPTPLSLLIWRRGFHVYHRRLSPDEIVVFSALRDHPPFAALCEQLAERRFGGDADAGARAMAGLLGAWLGDEILIDGAD